MLKNTLLNKLALLGIILSTLFATSCTSNFENWNTNPHEATDGMLEWDNLATGAYFVQMQKNLMPIEQLPEIGADSYQSAQNLHGDIFSGYMGACGTWFNGSNSTTYNMIAVWGNEPFARTFVGVMPSWLQIKKKAMESEPHVFALATVVKVGSAHRVADMYGPLPYKAFGGGSFTTKYDSQEDVYNEFFRELDEAIETLTGFYDKDNTAMILAKYDLVFGGNVKSWIKYANTLRLRLAMRIVNVNPALAQEEAEKAVNHSVGVITDATEVVSLNHTYSNYRHPLYVIGEGEFKETKMGATMDSYMNGYKDPRISNYFKPVDGKYIGVRTGIRIRSKEDYAEGAFSFLNVSAAQDLVWMNPTESYFLRAEGALRSWDMGGTAEQLYEDGVRMSFNYLGASGVDQYLNDDTSISAPYTDSKDNGNNIQAGNSQLGTITIKWDESATFAVKLERIITQKWIAIFPDGQEAWSEFRRTGYPKVFRVRVNNSGGLINTSVQIRRLPFPQSEYEKNKENVQQAVSLLGGGSDNGGTKLWWNK